MAENRADRFDRADFVSRSGSGTGSPPPPPEKPPQQHAGMASTLPAMPPPPAASSAPRVVLPPSPPSAPVSTSAAPAWRRSELRPDDQIVNIVETGSPPVAPLTDDARSGFVLRDGDSNRVILVDTGPAPAQRITQGTTVPLVQGSPVALAQGTAVPLTAGQAVPLSQGTAVPAAEESSPLSLIKRVLGNPALRTAAANALSAERSGDAAWQEQGESDLLSTALGSVLSNFGSD